MIYPENFENKIGFEAVRQQLMDGCVSTLGREHCRLMRFETDYALVCRLLTEVDEMLALVSSGSDVPLGDVVDCTGLLKQIQLEGTYLPATDVAVVDKALLAIEKIVSFFRNSNGDSATSHPALDGIVEGMTTFGECRRQIARVIDRYGNVKDNASDDLWQIRRQISQVSSTINSVMRKVMADAVKQGYIELDTTPTMRDGRMVLPVSPMYKRKIGGIVHDESASGKTVFVEPAEVVEVNNRVRELQIQEHREIVKILIAVATEIRRYIPDIISTSEVMGYVDFIHAKALFALETDSHKPNISKNPELELYHACHPVLMQSLKRHGKQIVPLDISLTSQKRILIISGPNAGGKSVCLKTVGIIQYMTQCGLLPPVYENSHIGIFDDIFVDIGDDQSLEDDLSTYSSHLKNMRLLMDNSRGGTLALIDEFGTGTEPQIGGALAQAILKKLNDAGIWAVITTHYQNIKYFAEDTPGLVNGSMLYDRQQMKPLFKLSIGQPGSSFAIEIARNIGLSSDIIDYARELVGNDYINSEKYLQEIARDRRYWENKRLAIRQKEKRIDEVLQKYSDEADELHQKRREILSQAKIEASEILSKSNAAIERTIHDIRRAQAEKERTAAARKKLDAEKANVIKQSEAENPIIAKAMSRRSNKKKAKTTIAPQPISELKIGDAVKLDGEGMAGEVVELQGGNAIVLFGLIKTTVAKNRLKPTLSKPVSAKVTSPKMVGGTSMDDSRQRQLNFKPEIDLRGMRVDEALQAVTYFIDDAVQFSVSKLRVLHGTGTGALRQAIRQYLDTVPQVKSYHDEHVQFGGAGITVVEL